MAKGKHIPVPKTANELWFDALVRHQVYLMRVSGGIRNDINGLLNKTEHAMVERIQSVLRGKTKLSPARLRKAESLIEQLKQIRTEVWIEVDGLWKDTMKSLTVEEVQRTNAILQTVSPAQLSTQLPTANALKSLVKTLPFEGRVLGSWAKKIARDDIERISAQVRVGVVQGEHPNVIARRIVGSARRKGADGVTQITRRNAEAITRTAVTSFSNASREMFFNENQDIFQKEIYTATLDGRTTLICMSYDGQRFLVHEGPMPPLHFNCRSLRVAEISPDAIGMRPAKPVTDRMLVKRYAAENDLARISKRKDLPRGHKGKYDMFRRKEMRRMTGRVPSKVRYAKWLPTQSVAFQDDVLGPTRGKLFRKGGLTLDKFVDKKGATITLAELADTETAAFRAAGLDPTAY
jgi:SPP1 gp7 family putative phage head morphogenesis protein